MRLNDMRGKEANIDEITNDIRDIEKNHISWKKYVRLDDLKVTCFKFCMLAWMLGSFLVLGCVLDVTDSGVVAILAEVGYTLILATIFFFVAYKIDTYLDGKWVQVFDCEETVQIHRFTVAEYLDFADRAARR